MTYRMTLASLLGAVALLVSACSDEVSVAGNDDDDADGGGGGGAGGDVKPPDPEPQLMTVRAPDEFSVDVVYSVAPPPEALDPKSYEIGGSGVLIVEGIDVDETGKRITLHTSKQKLGVTYTLTIVADGKLEGMGREFISADTATFWATDMSNPSFPDYQLVADRKMVGDHSVIYVEQGSVTANVQQASSLFDNKIYPITTALYTNPDDIDGNEKIVLLGLDGKGAYGGYFSPVNTLPDKQTWEQWGMHSNEMEMVYINVEYGYFDAETVLTHEFGHLLYSVTHSLYEDWSWHNEGLAECAVNAVNGYHPWALDHYVSDPSGQIAAGLSLVNWQFGNYDQYVLSYIFHSYVAGQISGSADGYGKLFDTNGHPSAVEALIQQELGIDFAEAQLRSLIASWVQDSSGDYSFNGLIDIPGKPPTHYGSSVSLEPFTGTFLTPASPSVDYPGTQGPNIVYAGIDSAAAVDLDAPFGVGGGALVVLNSNFELNDLSPEPSGVVMPPPSKAPPQPQLAQRNPAWVHPPPLNPVKLEGLRRWQELTRQP